MKAPSRPLYIDAAFGTNSTGRPPVWMMRQAGRYLPEYRNIRQKHSFLEMIRTPEIACEITLQPIQRFGFDAAILYSDILVTADAMGAPVQFIEKQGPVFAKPIRTRSDVQALSTEAIADKLDYVSKAIRLIKTELSQTGTPLIGFAGAPFTVAAYVVEGKSSPDLKILKTLMFSDPELVHALLQKLTGVTISYLKAQILAGVDALQLFDTWAIHLSWEDYKTFILPYITQIITEVNRPDGMPFTYFCKGSSIFAPLISDLPMDVLGVDWTASLLELRRSLRPTLSFQGNLDPYTLLGTPEELLKRVDQILSQMGSDPGYIFNLGHGLMPDIHPDQVRRVVDRVQSYAFSHHG